MTAQRKFNCFQNNSPFSSALEMTKLRASVHRYGVSVSYNSSKRASRASGFSSQLSSSEWCFSKTGTCGNNWLSPVDIIPMTSCTVARLRFNLPNLSISDFSSILCARHICSRRTSKCTADSVRVDVYRCAHAILSHRSSDSLWLGSCLCTQHFRELKREWNERNVLNRLNSINMTIKFLSN